MVWIDALSSSAIAVGVTSTQPEHSAEIAGGSDTSVVASLRWWTPTDVPSQA